VLLVGALRKPLRRVAGARVAYWLWLAVPANSLAVLLPVPSHTVRAITHFLPSPLTGVSVDQLVSASSIGSSSGYAVTALATWLAGVVLVAALFANRQRAFVRSLGRLTADSDGTLRSDRIRAPMLVGAWRPRVIVPADFETLYPEEDRVLMLRHERAHRERGDAVVNSLAAAWVCLFWFNPLMYWAVRRMRFDQELACDALVLAQSGTGIRRYADALLKAQLISETDWRVPVGCHWQSGHPLKERIAMLKLPSPGLSRRLAGIGFAVVLMASGVCVVSSSLAQAPAQTASSASRAPSGAESQDKKIAVDARDADTREVLAMIARKGNQNVLVSDRVSGKITVHLKDVTWAEALEIVVQSKGLTTRQSGAITIVDVPR
jgi:bla regulator protein blaR1